MGKPTGFLEEKRKGLEYRDVEERIRDFECEWRTAEDLLAAGYRTEEIDGGWAFNGYYDYERAPERSGARSIPARD